MNEYIFLCVLNYLSIQDRVKFERVSKEWKRLLSRLSLQQKTLFIKDSLANFHRPLNKCFNSAHDVRHQDDQHLIHCAAFRDCQIILNLIRRCRNIKYLSLERLNHSQIREIEFGQELAKCCPLLEHIDLCDKIVSSYIEALEYPKLTCFATWSQIEKRSHLIENCLHYSNNSLWFHERFYRLLEKSTGIEHLFVEKSVFSSDVRNIVTSLPNLISITLTSSLVNISLLCSLHNLVDIYCDDEFDDNSLIERKVSAVNNVLTCFGTKLIAFRVTSFFEVNIVIGNWKNVVAFSCLKTIVNLSQLHILNTIPII
jgi:F-box domain